MFPDDSAGNGEKPHMIRNVDMKQISDGKLYGLHDMVRADCGDCRGCSYCCHMMGDTIILDPLDICLLTTNLGRTFEEMMQDDSICLHVQDGVILPSLNLHEGKGCSFLTPEGRCSVHGFRPGLCRIFPLGRFYREETRDFLYFLQTRECRQESRAKVKVSKWIDVPNLQANQAFIGKWHFFIRRMQRLIQGAEHDGAERGGAERGGMDEQSVKQLNMLILQLFFCKPYDPDRDFYEQFEERMARFPV